MFVGEPDFAGVFDITLKDERVVQVDLDTLTDTQRLMSHAEFRLEGILTFLFRDSRQLDVKLAELLAGVVSKLSLVLPLFDDAFAEQQCEHKQETDQAEETEHEIFYDGEYSVHARYYNLMKRSKSVNDYIRDTDQWQDELQKLRDILNDTSLVEAIKWGAPCYTYKGKNVVGLAAFKQWFCLWFHQGALLADRNKVLMNAQEGRTKALRQWRMTSAGDIKPRIIKRYVKEAIALIDAGKEIKADRSKPVEVPVELGKAMRRYKGATAAFRSLTKGKQREYADYIASAKRDDTRKKRIDKILPMIAAGTGLNDKYRNC